MHRTYLLLPVLLLALPIAGCLGPVGTENPPAEMSPSDPANLLDRPLTVANNATGCRLAVAVLTVDLARIQEALPDGYTARDAQGLLGTPAPTGEGAMLVSVFSCTQTDLQPHGWDGAEVNLYIEPPDVNGSRPSTDHDYYQPLAVGADGNVSALLDAYGWTRSDGSVSVDLQMLPSETTTVEASASDGEGTIWTVELTSQAQNPFAGLNRFWTELPSGVSYFDYVIDTEVVVGAAACDLRAGSVPAGIAGRTACEPGDVGIVAPEMGWVSSFHYVPGEQVG